MAERRIPRSVNCTTDLRILKTYVPVEKWNEVMDRAEKARLSVSRYLSALIDRDELDADGCPAWTTSSVRPANPPLPGLETPPAA